MNQSVRFQPEALDDLLETQDWYASWEPALAQAFAGAIAYAVERIAQDQAAFPFVHGAVRRLVVRRFPYAVYFREVGDEIVVLAIHGRQDPKRLQERS